MNAEGVSKMKIFAACNGTRMENYFKRGVGGVAYS